MARARTEPDPAPQPSETEQREAEAEAAAREAEAVQAGSPEVRPDEFNAGIGQPVAGSAWPQEIVDELKKPLDSNRVRRREGRGRDSYEYLAGHDIKRRASEIFGFGNWGHRVIELREIAAVAVDRTVDEWIDTDGGGRRKSGNKVTQTGWHVGYTCIVRVWVRHEGGMFETDGVGYGDGVEYTAGARVQACELATKESETDALKRAFTDLGDQFGLILYAKDDEKKRIDRERNRSEATHREAVRQEPQSKIPANWTEALQRFDKLVADEDAGAFWLGQLVQERFQQESLQALSSDDRQVIWVGFASSLLALEEQEGEIALQPGLRARIQAAFAAKNSGVHLEGPPWRLGPDEEDRPTHAEWEAAGTDAVASEIQL